MAMTAIKSRTEYSNLKVYHERVHLETKECLQFLDITDLVVEQLGKSGISDGLVNIQTQHTTTAIVINENEPLLLRDMQKVLENLAPQQMQYLHNDFTIRTTNLSPNESRNGHSHCKAMFLKTSESLNIVNGVLQLGQWQRIFLLELDGARKRRVSIMVMGAESPDSQT